MNQTTQIEHRDYLGAKLGMWLFLFTEMLLFGGMFLVYAVYREMNAPDFHEAGKEMSLVIGAVNTVILLTSSLTMVLSISAIKQGANARSVLFTRRSHNPARACISCQQISWNGAVISGTASTRTVPNSWPCPTETSCISGCITS